LGEISPIGQSITLGLCLKITEVGKNFWLHTFFLGESTALILTKMGWATFWAIFSQTHLVTLNADKPPSEIFVMQQQ
jgi:hypothetical protein